LTAYGAFGSRNNACIRRQPDPHHGEGGPQSCLKRVDEAVVRYLNAA
jgi:hypothetical protein